MLPLVLEALNVSKDEIRRLLSHYRVKCVTQYQRTRFEVKVLGHSTEQQPKANLQQHKRTVEKEKMD